MSRSCAWWLLLALAGMLAGADAISAQGRGNGKYGRPYVAIAPDSDLEDILRANLEQAQSLERLKGFLEQMKSIEAIDRFIKGGNFDPADVVKQENALKLIETVRKAEPGLYEKAKKLANLNDADLKRIDKFVKDRTKKPEKSGQEAPRAAGAGIKEKKSPEQPFDPPDLDRGEEAVRTVRDWLESMEKEGQLSDLLRDSPAIQEAVDEMTASLLAGAGDGGRWQLGAADQLGKAAGFFDNAYRFFENGGFSMPGPPRFRFPRISPGGLPSFGPPGLGGPAAATGTGIWQVLLWGGVFVLAGLILWQVLSRLKSRAAQTAAEGPGWRPGSWPVDPSRVASRAEIIQAFEFLSLLLLGLPARTWNHRDIALGMGCVGTGGSVDTADAADRLAGLYEQARYAPETGPLPGPALAAARRDLCFLAGVKPS
jgi:hypothetical protein